RRHLFRRLFISRRVLCAIPAISSDRQRIFSFFRALCSVLAVRGTVIYGLIVLFHLIGADSSIIPAVVYVTSSTGGKSHRHCGCQKTRQYFFHHVLFHVLSFFLSVYFPFLLQDLWSGRQIHIPTYRKIRFAEQKNLLFISRHDKNIWTGKDRRPYFQMSALHGSFIFSIKQVSWLASPCLSRPSHGIAAMT